MTESSTWCTTSSGRPRRSPSSAARSRISLWSAAKAGSFSLSGVISSTGMTTALQVAVGRGVLERGGALLALEQELHAAQAALDLPDAGDDAHRVEDVGRRLVGVVALGDGEDEPVALERGLDGAQRARPAGGDRRGQAREDDRPAQREDGERLALSHGAVPVSEMEDCGEPYAAAPPIVAADIDGTTGPDGVARSIPCVHRDSAAAVVTLLAPPS